MIHSINAFNYMGLLLKYNTYYLQLLTIYNTYYMYIWIVSNYEIKSY